MKVVILCGGLGTRLADETKLKPKPMVKICNKPILSHITEIYERNGFREFIFALGYKGHVIRKYYLKKKLKSKISLVDTGKNTLKKVKILC